MKTSPGSSNFLFTLPLLPHAYSCGWKDYCPTVSLCLTEKCVRGTSYPVRQDGEGASPVEVDQTAQDCLGLLPSSWSQIPKLPASFASRSGAYAVEVVYKQHCDVETIDATSAATPARPDHTEAAEGS